MKKLCIVPFTIWEFPLLNYLKSVYSIYALISPKGIGLEGQDISILRNDYPTGYKFMNEVEDGIHNSEVIIIPKVKNSSLRTSLLLCSNKAVFFVIKFFVTSVFIFIVSFVSIYLSIASAQFGLEREGLSPLILSNNVWYFILLGSLSWSLLTVLSYSMAFYFKSSLGSLLFLLPQVYNLGSFLADRIQLAKYLPVSLGQDLIATSPLKITTPGRSVLFLSTWVLVISSFAYYKFLKEDVGNVR